MTLGLLRPLTIMHMMNHAVDQHPHFSECIISRAAAINLHNYTEHTDVLSAYVSHSGSSLQVRQLLAIGFTIKKNILAEVETANRFYRHGLLLKQVVNFYNNSATEIIPSQKAMLLQVQAASFLYLSSCLKQQASCTLLYVTLGMHAQCHMRSHALLLTFNHFKACPCSCSTCDMFLHTLHIPLMLLSLAM